MGEYVHSIGTTVNTVRAEVVGGTVVQAGTVTFRQPDPPRPALDTLPAAGILAGRDGELADVLAALAPDRPGPRAAVVGGLGGAGKTALAVAAAREAVRRGWFDGALFVPLHGHHPDAEARVTVDQALEELLLMLGVPAERVPASRTGRAALYRSELAARGRDGTRLLVLADDAAEAAALAPLLPAHPGHALLATSRETLAELDGFRLVELAGLAEEDGRHLLDLVLAAADPADRRPREEPAAAADLVRQCAGLPLALRITAALLVADPGLRPTDLAAELADAANRLDVLQYGGQLAVRAAFDLSHRRLDPALAALFARLALAPGPHLTPPAAAALADLPPRTAARQLAALRRAHLLEAAPAGRGAVRFHDLVRLYAAERAARDLTGTERTAAVTRLLDHLADALRDADARLGTDRPATDDAAEHAARAEALDWFDTERDNLLAAVHLAADTHPGHARTTARLLDGYLAHRWRSADRVAVAASLARACRELGDRQGEGWALATACEAHRDLGDGAAAARAAEAALGAAREIGDQRLTAGVHNDLGDLARNRGDLDAALHHHRQAVRVHRLHGTRHGLAVAQLRLAGTLRAAGRTDAAIVRSGAALRNFLALGDRNRAASALAERGSAQLVAGQPAAAVDSLEQALALYLEFHQPQREAEVHGALALARLLLGETEAAAGHARRSVALADTHGRPERGADAEALLAAIERAAAAPPGRPGETAGETG
ncbi:tetratricopeptide repeat protein [Kitasatospora sp. NPDC088134]|uniref:tetratricopeptide repeat protein n=1 Tax=Kitasatospora sp. NPDC088134 TaxID=3364071 RepID=UPI0038154758